MEKILLLVLGKINFEFIIFFLIECTIVLTFFMFFRYSRNNGGAFDRRIGERRLQKRRIMDRMTVDRRSVDNGFSRVKVESADTSEFFEVDFDRRIYGRRFAERRSFLERRSTV